MTTTPEFTISDAAAKRLTALLGSKEKGRFMRISVLGGGCSGFEYKFEFDNQLSATDTPIGQITNTQSNQPMVVIDEVSYPFLKNATLDFEDSLGNTRFHILNPLADSSCGCGNSFSLDLSKL